MLVIGSSSQRSQNPARRDQTKSNADGMGLVAPWQVCFFLNLSCHAEHFCILSQILVMHKNYDTWKFFKKFWINSNECKLKIYCMERKLSYFLWIMLNIVGCTQKNQNLSCLGEHILILSQLLHLLKNCDIGKCDKKSRINTNVCK